MRNVHPSGMGRRKDGGQNIALLDQDSEMEHQFEVHKSGGVFYRGNYGEREPARIGNIDDEKMLKDNLERYIDFTPHNESKSDIKMPRINE
jgi:hypothetical protein